MGNFKSLDLELQEMSLTQHEYINNKIALVVFLTTNDSKYMSLKLRGFWKQYLEEHREERDEK